MAFIEVDETNIEQHLESQFEQGQTLIIKFGSEWCEPCHALEGELEDVDDDHENVTVLMVDTDTSAELAAQYSVHALPTMLIYNKNREMIYRGEGVLLAQDIEELITNAMMT